MDETSRSIYKADGKLYEQERDVAKYWKDCSVRIALYGLENQTQAEKDMPLRVISYDGAAYRRQLLKDQNEEDARKEERYPVVTLVLYFGYEKHWDKPLTLSGCLKIPETLKPFVKDYGLNLFEIAWLTDEQVQMFQSDFKIVADYFVQMRKNRDYQLSQETMLHVDEVLKLLAVLTQDDRFEDIINQKQEKGEVKTMCEVLDRVEARGKAEGRAEGKAEGKESAILQAIKSLMKTMKLAADQAMESLEIPVADRGKYLSRL